MSGILTGVKPIKMANGGLVPSGGLPYGNPQGTLGGYGGMGLGTGSGYAEGGDVDYKELAKGIGSFAGELLDPRDPINALLYALWLFPPAGAAATAGKLAYAGGKGIKAIRTAKKAKRLSKLAPELTGKKVYDLGHKATAGGLGAYFGKELVEAAPDLYEIAETAVTDPEIIMEIIKESVPRKMVNGGTVPIPGYEDGGTAETDNETDSGWLSNLFQRFISSGPDAYTFDYAGRGIPGNPPAEGGLLEQPDLKQIQLMQKIPGMEKYAEFLMQNYELSKLSPEAMEIIEELVPRKAEGGLLEAPVLYAAGGKALKKKAKTVAQKVKEKKKKADADKKKKADEAKQKKADEKAKKDRDKAEKKQAEEQKKADEKIRKEEEIALKNRSGYQKFTDWRKGLPWYGRFPLYPPLAVGAAGWIGKRQLDKRAVKREAEEKRKQLVEQIETAQAKATDVDAQAEREATSAEKRRRNRALIAAGREMTKYTEGYVPYNWLSDAASAYSDTMAGKDEPELIQTAYAMMAENPELKFEDALRSVLSRGAVGAVDPELQEIQMMQSIPGLEETAEFLLQQYYLTRLSPEALSRVSEAATEIE